MPLGSTTGQQLHKVTALLRARAPRRLRVRPTRIGADSSIGPSPGATGLTPHVQVLDVWENGFAPRRADGFVDAMRGALRASLRFAEAGRLEWASHLGAEKRRFLTRS